LGPCRAQASSTKSEQWRNIDKSIDAALQQLRADNPQAAAVKQALQNLLAGLDRPSDDTSGKAQATAAAKLSIKDIITALETFRAGESVLDVSFEPKDSQPVYAVRTYAKGKVWDGLIDGVTGAAIDNGTVTDESALDDEDKSELAASKHAKITLREAVDVAEKANDSRALSAGLEQVRGRVVWEILFQEVKHKPMHIDPITGMVQQ